MGKLCELIRKICVHRTVFIIKKSISYVIYSFFRDIPFYSKNQPRGRMRPIPTLERA